LGDFVPSWAILWHLGWFCTILGDFVPFWVIFKLHLELFCTILGDFSKTVWSRLLRRASNEHFEADHLHSLNNCRRQNNDCQIFAGKTYQNGGKYTKMTSTFTKIVINYTKKGRIIFQMALKYTNIFHSTALQNIPTLGIWVWKYTIWQSCDRRSRIQF
jgi:hypothetical protein